MTEVKVIRTPEGRVSYPNVFTPRPFEEGSPPTYSMTLIFGPDADLTELREQAKAAAIAKWGSNLPKNLKSPFLDPDSDRPEHEGSQCYIRTNSPGDKPAPGIVGTDLDPLTQKLRRLDEVEFYAGCYAQATVRAYAYDKKGNKGVSFGLQNVQKLRDGERLGGRAPADDEFEPVAVDSDADAGDIFEDDNAGSGEAAADPFA